jgi:ubiquinone/menaquinone biosynthesis C-methylase UbiE
MGKKSDIREKMREEWNKRAKENFRHYISYSKTEDEFEESGRINVDNFVKKDLKLITDGGNSKKMRILEIGCGAGRMTKHLGEIFGEVHGVDVSDEMIRLGKTRLKSLGNVHLYHNNGSDLSMFSGNFFDFVFSFITFQHIPEKEVIVNYIKETHRVLNSNRIFKFQVQGYLGEEYLKTKKDTWLGVPFSEDEMKEIAKSLNFEVVDMKGQGTQYFWAIFRKYDENVRKNYSYEVVKERLKNVLIKMRKRTRADLSMSVNKRNEELEASKQKSRREDFIDRINVTKRSMEKSVNFYPYHILSNLTHLDNLLRDINLSAEDVLTSKTVNDIGGADGDIAFYCEFLGAEKVSLIDYAPTNFNHLMAAKKLKDALNSNVNIVDMDLSIGWEKIERVETTIFLGILYHLQNPLLALSQLSKKSKYLLLSTKVFDVLNGKDVSSLSIGYFYNHGEYNNDPTNWWCFTDECVKRLIDRSGWEIIAYKRFGCNSNADPIDNQKDGRAFTYLKSKVVE